MSLGIAIVLGIVVMSVSYDVCSVLKEIVKQRGKNRNDE